MMVAVQWEVYSKGSPS